MMGRRDFEAKLYYQLSLDQLVPQDHLLRRVAAAIDFSFVRPLCRPYYSHTGQPSVDPVVTFKVLLVGYLYGVTSERRLAQEVNLHLGYRWFLGYDFDAPTPGHSVLSKARARFGNSVFEEFFRQSIELCRAAGLLDKWPVYVDSTLIRASAAVDSLTRRAEMARPPLSVAEYLQRLDEEDAAATEAPLPDAVEALASRPMAEPYHPGHLRPVDPPPSEGGRVLRPNQELLSRTDPEATLVNRPTTRFGNQHTGIWGREQWLPDEDVFLCPAGERLRRYSNMKGTQRVRYQAPKGSCAPCPYRAQCAPSGIERSLHRSWALDLVDAAQERVASPLGKRRLVERKTYIEGTFGLAKDATQGSAL